MGEGGLGLEAQAGAPPPRVLPPELRLCSALPGSSERALQTHPQVLRPGEAQGTTGGRGRPREPRGRPQEAPWGQEGRGLASLHSPHGGPGQPPLDPQANAEMEEELGDPGPVSTGLGPQAGCLPPPWQIISALEGDPVGQKTQLACRLQQIAALVENKVTDL